MNHMNGVEEQLGCESHDRPDTFGDDQDQPESDHTGERCIPCWRRPSRLTVQEQNEPNGEAQFAWPERRLAESQLGRRRQKEP